MNINLIDHRLAREQRQRFITVWRCTGAFSLGLLMSWPPVWWASHERSEWTLALQAEQAKSNELQRRQVQWDQQIQAWPSWARHNGISAEALKYGQGFEHLYYLLEAAVAGLGVAIAPEPLVAEDVADAIGWVVTRPAHVNVDELVIRPRAQAAQHKVHRTG